MKRQKYILRYYLPVKPNFDENFTEKRFVQLLGFCKAKKIDSVMFYVSLHADCYYMNSLAVNEKKVRDQMLPYIERLRKAGLGYELNFQNLLGSHPHGADFRAQYPWRNLVDQYGEESQGCACPLCTEFRKDAEKRLKMWAETSPDVIWIDDDLRMHNHGTPYIANQRGDAWYLDFYCFCEEHIRLFNERVGANYTRESLISAMMETGNPSSVRIQYLDFLNDTVVETASWIEKTVHSVNPKIRLAQMTSVPDVHSTEGRRWEEFLPALCGKFTPILRPHFGPYIEPDSKEMVQCYRMVAQTRAQVEENYHGEVEYCPEVENTRFTVWAKTAMATSYQLAMSAFLGNDKITLSLFDLDGGSFSDEPRYGEMLKKQKPFLDKILKLSLKDEKLLGVKIPTSNQSGRNYHYSPSDRYQESSGTYRNIERYLLKIGIPCVYTAEKDLGTGVVALDEFTANYMPESELKRIFSGAVFLDGGAAEVLLSRGFGQYIGISALKKMDWHVNVEEIKTFARKDGTPIRIPLRTPLKCWYTLTLQKGAQVLSELVDMLGTHSAGMTLFTNELGGKVVTYPLKDNYGDGFFNHYRIKFIKDVLGDLSQELPRVDVNGSAIVCVKETNDGTKYYFYANLSPDETQKLTIEGKVVKEKLALYQSVVYKLKNGKLKKIAKSRKV